MSMVEVHSLPCPGCGDRITIAATVPQFMAYMSRGQFVQGIFPELDNDTRERFISGVCPTCWEEMYPEEVCEDCGGGCEGVCEYGDEEEVLVSDYYGYDGDFAVERVWVYGQLDSGPLDPESDDLTYESGWYVD